MVVSTDSHTVEPPHLTLWCVETTQRELSSFKKMKRKVKISFPYLRHLPWSSVALSKHIVLTTYISVMEINSNLWEVLYNFSSLQYTLYVKAPVIHLHLGWFPKVYNLYISLEHICESLWYGSDAEIVYHQQKMLKALVFIIWLLCKTNTRKACLISFPVNGSTHGNACRYSFGDTQSVSLY